MASLLNLIETSRVGFLDNKQIVGAGTYLHPTLQVQVAELYVIGPQADRNVSFSFADQNVTVPGNNRINGILDLDGVAHDFRFVG